MTKHSNGAGPQSAKERREAILSMSGILAEEKAYLPGPNGVPIPVVVREITGKESKEFEMAIAADSPTALGLLLQMCLRDPDTKELLFEPADREVIESLGMAGLGPVLKVAQRVSGLSEADVEAAKRSLVKAPTSA